MKRGYRALSFILVLSLLFSSLVFTTSAAEQEDYYVDENAELFIPSAHYTTITDTNAYNILNALKVDGSETTGFGPSALYGGSNVNSYLVSSEITEDYVMIVPTKTAVQNGKVTDHVQVNTYIHESFAYDAAKPSYYVFEMDVATESGILPIFYQVVTRNHDAVQDNGKTVDAWGASWHPGDTANSLYMTMTPGVFHHVTFIGDVDNNVLYVYIDNQLAATQTNGVTSTLMHSYYKNNGANLRIEGMRIQMNSGIKVNGNMSYCFKDLYEKVLTGDESDSLSDYAGKPTLQGWTGNRYEAHADNKLPALININGIEYNNTVDASNALDSYKENNEAELMRSVYSGDIIVDCDALIHTYSVEVSLSEGPHATLTKVDGSTWQSTLHTDKYSTELVLSNPQMESNLANYLKYDLEGNIVSEILINNAGQTNGVNADIMQSSKGNQYVYVYDNSANAYDTTKHFYMNASMSHTSDNAIKGHDFVVFDFDIYSESELINVYNGFQPRSLTLVNVLDEYGNPKKNADGTNVTTYPPLSATTFFLTSNLTGTNYIQIESGIWNHFTFVGEVATGYAYVYRNNKLVHTIQNGLYTKSTNDAGEIVALDSSGNEYTLDDVTINSFRCMQIAGGVSGNTLTQEMSICFDNFDARFVDGDHTLVAGMEDLSGWVTNLYGNGYQFAELPAIAAVDGVEYYDIYSLTEALTPIYPTTVAKKVVLLREFKGNFTVNCNATVEARGFDSHVSIGTGCSSSTTDGIITVTCPMSDATIKESLSVNFSGGTVLDSGVGILTGTKESTVRFDSANDNLNVTKVYTKADTNPFYIVTPGVAGSTKINSYIQFEKGNAATIKYGDTSTAYYVIDLDVATSGEFIPNVNVSAVLRNNDTGGQFPFSTDLMITEIPNPGDKWAHLTLVGDIAANKVYLYVNGEYLGEAGTAYNASQATSADGLLRVNGVRIQFGSGSYSTTRELGQDIYLDNITERVYQDIDNDNGLSEAIAAGSLKDWSDYYNGRGGTILPPVVLVDGVPYASQASAELALVGEKTADVEVISASLTALQVNCNAVINTNGFAVNITHGSDFTSTTSGNIVTVSGHFVENMQSITTTNATAILNAIKYPADDNRLGTPSLSATNTSDTIKWGEVGGRASDLITNTDNNNVFYKEYPNGTVANTGNDYVNYNFTSFNPKKVDGQNEYVVVDFDFAYDSLVDAVAMQLIVRKSGSALWATNQQLKLIGGLTAGKFAHVTAVYDFTNNYAYFFVNGERVTYNNQIDSGTNEILPHSNGVFSAAGATEYANGTTLTCSEFRIGSNSNSTFYIDNMYIRHVTESTSKSDSLATAINAGTTRAWVDNVYTSTYNMTDWPSIATVNGIDYSYHDDIQALLDKVDNAEMEFNRLDTETYTFSSPATVKTNGLAVSYDAAEGYKTSFNSTTNVLTVSPTGEGNLTLNIDGVQVLNETLPYGTDIRELLTEYGFGAASKTIAYGGEIYTGVTWTASNAANMDSSTGTPTGHLNSDLTLTATGGSVSDKPFILLDASGAIVNNDYSESAIMNFFLTNGNGTIILGDNWTISTVNNQITAGSGTMNVCLNGYSIIDAGDGTNHTWRYDANSTCTKNFNFYGGTLDFDKNVAGRAIFYVTYTYTGKILFKNVDIDTSYSVAHLRSGDMELIGCNIDAYLVDATYNGLFMLAEDYNTTFSTNPISLTITNTDIDLRYHSDANAAMIVHRVVSTGYKVDPKVTVIINNSDIVTQYALAEAYRGHQASDGTVDTGAAEKSNMTIYLNKVSLVAESLANKEMKSGSIVFYEDVKTNIEDTSCVAFITELSKVKTSNGMTPYLYTSHDYGSVTWSNGNVELWASGSLPTHEICKYDNAVIVEKGKVYTYNATTTTAPIKFLVNLTLSNEITFNFYVPTSEVGAKVYLDGQLVEAGEEITYVSLAASDCYNYSISLSPEEAAKEFVVSIVLQDGKTLTRTMSVGLYAEKLSAQVTEQLKKDPDNPGAIRNKALLGAALNYIKAASSYSGVHTDLTTITKILNELKPSTTAPTGTKQDTTAIQSYITGVQINADSSSRFRFNLSANADLSSLSFEVDGDIKNHTVAADGSYVELSLRAYEMTHDITISINGVTATYNLYTYYAGLSELASGTDSAAQRDATKAKTFIEALYNYATVADEHLDAKDAE